MKHDRFCDVGVCMVTYAMPPEHSGAAKQAITLASQLAARGVNIFFVTQGNIKRNLSINRIANFLVIRIYKETLFWKIIAPFRFLLTFFRKRSEFSIIHVHGVGYLGKLAVLFGMLFNKKVILKMTMFTEDDALSIKQSGWLNFWSFKRATHYIGITQSFVDSCINAGIPPNKISLIPNGVDTNKFYRVSKADKRDLRERLKLPLGKTILVYAGIIRPEKGIDFLLDTIDCISKQRDDIVLLILGPLESWLPPAEQLYAENVVKRMLSPDLRNYVLYPGKTDNIHEYFQASDIFVSASRREGFPNVLIEAMATGLAPVVIGIPNIHDHVIENGVTGIVVTNRDTYEYSERIIDLVGNSNLQNSITNAALNAVVGLYSIETVADKYTDLYKRLMQAPPTARLRFGELI